MQRLRWRIRSEINPPVEVDKIADLHKLVSLLVGKGYTDVDIAAIIGENWLTKIRGAS